MAQSLAKICTHLVFSTKSRIPYLSESIAKELHSYMGQIFKSWNSPAFLVNSTQDHVHALFELSRNHALSKVVEHVKKGSSKWIKTKDGVPATFHWQNGYGAFSVSQSDVATVKAYIAGQKDHHRQKTFQEELRELLTANGLIYDERYLWD